MEKNLKEKINKHVKYWVDLDKIDGIKIDFDNYYDMEYVEEHFTQSHEFTKEEIKNKSNVEYFIKQFKKKYNSFIKSR